MDDELAGLTRLSHQLEDMARHANAAAAAAAGPIVGSDETGSVSVVVDDDGVITTVEVDPGWREVVGVAGLGTAVVGAAVAAVAIRTETFLEAWMEAEAQDEAQDGAQADRDPQPVVPRDFPPMFGPTFAPRPGRPTDGSMAELAALLHNVNQDIDRLSVEIQSLAGDHTGTSRAGHVSATVTGALTLVDVDFDKRWLVNADDHNITTEMTEALRAAYERAGRRTVADLIARSTLGELVAPTNPEEPRWQ
jgi:DNA-binding protein YbaB